jgi:hypothetical protein
MTATLVRATFVRPLFVSATFVMALALAAPMAPARAADLDGDRYAQPYEEEEGYVEEGYDSDGPPPGRYSEAPPPDTYSRDVPDRPGSIKDGYPVPVPAPRAATERWEKVERVERVERYDPPPPRVRGPRYAACLETWQVRRELRHRGWTDIRPMGGDGSIVHVRARRFDSSSVFGLRVDRCSGEVLAARPYHLRSFAYGERPWRY